MTDPIVRANDAKAILNSPLFMEMRGYMEGKLQYLRRNAPITATQQHTYLIMLEQAWGDVLGWFEQLEQTGKIEADFLERQERQKASMLDRLKMFRMMGRNTL